MKATLPGLIIGLVLLGVVIGSSGCTAPANQQAGPKAYFEGKTITIVVNNAAGGGTDLIGRLITRFLPKYLPGKPTMIVRNMPGGEGIIGANYAYQAKPDGLTGLAGSGPDLMAQLLGMKGVAYDYQKMAHILGTTQTGIYYAKAGVVDKPENILKAKGMVFGHSSGAMSILFVIAKELTNFPADKVILAYTGTGDALRAFLSGETNTSYSSVGAYRQTIAPLVAKGEVVALFQPGILDDKGNVVRDSAVPEVPTIPELYQMISNKPPSGEAWEAAKSLMATRTYVHLFRLPPGTPESIVKMYWDASEKMVKDPAFLEIAIPQIGGEGSGVAAGETVDKTFKATFRISPEVQKWLRATVSRYGVTVE